MTTTIEKKTCEACGKLFGPSKGQHRNKFLLRKTCGRHCGQVLARRTVKENITASRQMAGRRLNSEIGKLLLSRESRFNGHLTRELTILAAAELRDVQRSIEYARQRMRPVGPLEHAARRLAEVLERSQWRVAV